jgi:hypothetical protein
MSTYGFTLYDMIDDFWREDEGEDGEGYLTHDKWELLILAIDIAKRAKQDLPRRHPEWYKVGEVMSHACYLMTKEGIGPDDIPDS